MGGKIVFEGLSKKGDKIIIRYPAKDDASLMCEYINNLSSEKTFVRFQGEKVSLKSETKYLNSQLKRINKNKTVQLFVFHNNKIIGIAAIDMKDKTESHEGVLGLSVSKEFRGEGIGSLLMKLTIEESIKNMSSLKIITLGVFGNNTLAMEMYRKLGFTEYGRLPKGSLHRDEYVDHVYMYKNVR